MKRFLHSFPEAPALAGRNVVHATPLVDPRIPQVPDFRVMGQGSMLQVQLPPSVDLVAKRNALTGILAPGSFQSTLTSRFTVGNKVFNRFVGRQPLLMQRIVTATPATCLLGSQNEFLSAIELDGSVDWVVKSPIFASCGKQLTKLPSLGLGIKAAAPFPHTLVSGRGWLCVTTQGSPVQISVAEGEQILVARTHLNAYSVDANSSQSSPKLTNVQFEFPHIKKDAALNLHTPSPSGTAALWFDTALRTAKKWFVVLHKLVRRFSLAGNTTQFVEIFGPATVLVSSSNKSRPVKELNTNSD